MLFAVGKYKLGELHPQCAKIATVFSGGVGSCHQELCGGLSGGLLVIGSLYGRINPEEDDVLVKDLGKKFREQFLKEFGSTKCEDVKAWLIEQGMEEKCDKVVERSAMMLMNLLDES